MRRLINLLCAVAAWTACQASTSQGTPAGETLWIEANGLRLKSTIYRSEKLSSRPVLIVALHGDLLGVRAVPSATYHYLFAQQSTLKMDDVVAVGLLRPGYRDHTGESSQGERGLTTGDNYTPEVVDAVAQAIDQLKERFHPDRTVLAGHSGGAAITGNLIGRWPAKVDAAFMVSCPCDLAAWRKHMMQMRNNNPIWSAPVKSLSPIDLAEKVPPSVRVRLLVGSKDDVAPPELSQRYAEALSRHRADVAVTVAPGLEHDILLEPIALDAMATLVKTLKGAEPTAR